MPYDDIDSGESKKAGYKSSASPPKTSGLGAGLDATKSKFKAAEVKPSNTKPASVKPASITSILKR